MSHSKKARAKASEKPKPLSALINAAVDQISERHFGNVYTADQLNRHFKVLEVWPFALQWILDANGFFLGKIYMLEGDPSAGKSQFGYGMGEVFVDNGGLFVLIETESKTSQKTMEAKMGRQRIESGRVIYHQTYSIDADTEASKEEKAGAWQAAVKNWIDVMTNQKNGLQNVPALILVDSMTGVAGAETRKEYEAGGIMKARSYGGAATANSLAKYFRNLSSRIGNTNITVAFTNHLKEGMIDQMRQRAGKKGKKGVGGEQPRFHSACTLWFSRGAETQYVSRTKRDIHISVHKQSFGLDTRRLTVPFYVTIEEDGAGESYRDIQWDWDEATTMLLHRFCGLKDSKDKAAIARKIFHLDCANGLFSSKTLGVEGLDARAMGKLINESKDIYEQLMTLQSLNINRYPTIVGEQVEIQNESDGVSDLQDGGEGQGLQL